MQLSDFHAGQTVVLVNFDMRFAVPKVTTVAKVGRKYVTLSGYRGQQFYVQHDTDPYLIERSIYGAPDVLFPSKEAYRLYREGQALRVYLRKVFDWSSAKKLTLDQLRRIKSIVDEKEVADDPAIN